VTRPWSPAEIAGAKALADQERLGCWEDLTSGSQSDFFADARAVLDAAGAGLRAEVAAELDALAAEIRGAGAGEQQ